MTYSPLLNQLIDALRCLPGVGPKSAQRMAFYLLQRNREGGLALAKILQHALTHIDHCTVCRTLSETELCKLCSNTQRDASLLCIVETPGDVIAIEQAGGYHGSYFVLMGHLSPLDGIGPQELGMDHLLKRLSEEPIKEIILATNPTIEGEATAHYIASLVKSRGIHTTRIAHGVPFGGDLDYVNERTLARALSGRIEV